MTNYEMHKEEFEKLLLENGVVFFSVVGDTVQVCGSTDCHDCLFDNSENCSKARAEWLKKEYGMPITSDMMPSLPNAFDMHHELNILTRAYDLVCKDLADRDGVESNEINKKYIGLAENDLRKE